MQGLHTLALSPAATASPAATVAAAIAAVADATAAVAVVATAAARLEVPRLTTERKGIRGGWNSWGMALETSQHSVRALMQCHLKKGPP